MITDNGIIYKILNNVNQKVYIGQTFQIPRDRISQHKHCMRHIHKHDYYIHKAMRKYGWKSFSWSILYTSDDRTLIDLMETFYITVYKSHVSEGGYNLTWGGDFNPMMCPDIRKRARNKLLISMKKYTGKNNVMSIPEIKHKHLLTMRELSESTEWKKAKAVGDERQKGTYEITSPDGKVYTIHGLNKFCKEHNLSQSKMSSVVSGNRREHKGYKCKRITYPKKLSIRGSKNKYLIRTPNDDYLHIDNLIKFCKECRLAYISMLAVSAGRQKQHKGYVCEKI